MTVVQQVTYGNAEARGRLRAWKKKLAKDYAVCDAAFHRLTTSDPACEDMVDRTKTGRRRAFEKIHRMLGPGVTLETLRLKGKEPFAVWSILKPRNALTAETPPDMSESEQASLMQDCITVNYVAIGYLGLAEGLWSMEVPDHGLGRAVERSSLLHPGMLIREAHSNLLALSIDILKRDTVNSGKSVLIKAGPGCFVGHFASGTDVSSTFDEPVFYFRAKTWVHNDQLHDDQMPLNQPGKLGERLGDGWLMPHPFRVIERGECGWTVRVLK